MKTKNKATKTADIKKISELLTDAPPKFVSTLRKNLKISLGILKNRDPNKINWVAALQPRT